MYGMLAMLGVAIIFGLFGVFIIYNSIMFGDLFQVALRNGIAFLLLIPILFWRRISFTFSKEEWFILTAYALASVFILVVVTLAYLNAPIKTVLAVRYSVTVVVSLLVSLLLFREQIKLINVISVFLALLGIGIFAYPFADFFSIGVLYSVITAVGFLIVGTILKKSSASPEALMAAEFFAIAVLVSGVTILIGAPTINTFSWFALTIMFTFSALLIVVTYLLVYGYRVLNFNLANIILTSEIIFGLFFGYLLLEQTVSVIEILGLLLIAIAVSLPYAIKLLQVQSDPVVPIQ
ncbi:DMT family transporter [Candidatus Pacebacteria bacterium]|nr:DMT family transporter [Candidatus Paceibacterota bacterium]